MYKSVQEHPSPGGGGSLAPSGSPEGPGGAGGLCVAGPLGEQVWEFAFEKAAGADCSCQAARWWSGTVGAGALLGAEDEEACGQVQGSHHGREPVLCRGSHLAVSVPSSQHNNHNLAHAACLELSDEISDMSDWKQSILPSV